MRGYVLRTKQLSEFDYDRIERFREDEQELTNNDFDPSVTDRWDYAPEYVSEAGRISHPDMVGYTCSAGFSH